MFSFFFFLFSHIILLLHSYFLIPPPPTIVGAAEVVVSVVELPKVNQKLSYASRLKMNICFALVVSWLLCAARGCHGYFCDFVVRVRINWWSPCLFNITVKWTWVVGITLHICTKMTRSKYFLNRLAFQSSKIPSVPFYRLPLMKVIFLTI